MASISCPTCNSNLSMDHYMHHLPACYLSACEKMKFELPSYFITNQQRIQPCFSFNGCEEKTSHFEPSFQASNCTESSQYTSIVQLPKDVLLLILEPFQGGHESPFLRLVCKRWNTLIPHKKLQLKYVAYDYAREGNLTAIKYLKRMTQFNSTPYISNSRTISYLFASQNFAHWMNGAAKGGQIEILKWATNWAEQNASFQTYLEKRGLGLCQGILCCGAESGSDEVVDWLLEHGAEKDIAACVYAADAGHYELAKKLYYDTWTRSTLMEVSAKAGNIELLDWLFENQGGDNSSELIMCGIQATQFNQIEVLEWLKSKGWEIDPQISTFAAENGSIKLITWVKDNGGEITEQAMSTAVRNGHIELVKWLRANGCPWNTQTSTIAAHYGPFEAVKWLYENSCPFQVQRNSTDPSSEDTINVPSLIAHSKLDTLKYLNKYEKLYFNNEECYHNAIENNNLEACKVLYELGCSTSPELWEYAFEYRNLPILAWLKTINCPQDDNTCSDIDDIIRYGFDVMDSFK